MELAEFRKHKVVVDTGEMIGDCYRNRNAGLGGARAAMGPIDSPLARLTFELNPGNLSSFFVKTSFPEHPLNLKTSVVELK